MGAGRFGLVDIGHEKNFAAIAFGPGAGVGKLLTLKITSVSPLPPGSIGIIGLARKSL
jgi:hypothetical protein